MMFFHPLLFSILLIRQANSVVKFEDQVWIYPRGTLLLTFNLTQALPISPDDFSIVLKQKTSYINSSQVVIVNPKPFNNANLSYFNEPVTWIIINPNISQCLLSIEVSFSSVSSLDCFKDQRCIQYKNVYTTVTLPMFFINKYTKFRQFQNQSSPPINVIKGNKNLSLTVATQKFYDEAYSQQASRNFDEETYGMTWIPYLDNCTDYGNYINLHEIITNNVVSTFSRGNPDKQWKTKCSFTQRIKTVPWWKKQPDTLFFIYSTPLTQSSISPIRQEINSNKNSEYIEMLIPVNTEWATASQQFLDRVTFEISLQSSQMSYKITQARLKLYFTDAFKDQTDLSILIHNEPQSMNNILRVVYSVNSTVRAALALVFLCFLTLRLGIITKVRKAKMVRFMRAVVLPIVKGYAILMVSGIGPVAVIFIIIIHSSLGSISQNFDNTLQVSDFAIRNGRVGLAFVFCGLYLLSKTIDTTYKIPNAQEANILYRDYIKNEKNMPDEAEIQSKAEQLSLIIQSKKFFIVISIFVSTLIHSFICQQLVSTVNSHYFLILVPLHSQLHRQVMTNVFSDIMYSLPLLMSSEFIYSLLCLKFNSYTQIIVYQAFIRFLCFVLPLLVEPLKRLYGKMRQAIFKQPYHQECHEYEETLWRLLNISCNLSSLVMRIACLCIWYLLRSRFQYVATVFPTKVLTNFTILLLLVPIEMLLLLNFMISFNQKCKFNLMEMFEYHQYRFRCRTHKWISDNFKYKETVKLEYRTFEKLCLSSQFHLYLAGMAFSTICIICGLIIIKRNIYNPFRDPLSLILAAMLYILGKAWHMILSLVSAKSKMYSLKEEKNLVKLDLTTSLSKKEDLSDYLEYDVAKRHFLKYCRSWIINNLPNILSKRSFHQNNRKILNLYIEKLNNQKRKKLEVKKRQIELEMLSRKTKTNIADGIHSLPRKVVENTVRPIIHRWLLLTRQHMFLNKYIDFTKVPQKFCEFCKIDVQLQVISKLPLLEVANAFRVQNIGKPFNPQEFINFYMCTQTRSTICFECKLKEEHLKLNQKHEINKVKNNVCAKLMIRKWIMCARSRILHCGPS